MFGQNNVVYLTNNILFENCSPTAHVHCMERHRDGSKIAVHHVSLLDFPYLFNYLFFLGPRRNNQKQFSALQRNS